jgi:hypothetical protein
MSRVMKDDGLLILTAPFSFRLHEEPDDFIVIHRTFCACFANKPDSRSFKWSRAAGFSA